MTSIVTYFILYWIVSFFAAGLINLFFKTELGCSGVAGGATLIAVIGSIVSSISNPIPNPSDEINIEQYEQIIEWNETHSMQELVNRTMLDEKITNEEYIEIKETVDFIRKIKIERALKVKPVKNQRTEKAK